MFLALDSHMHGDILYEKDKSFPKVYYEKKIGGIIWAYNEKVKKIGDYVDYWNFLKEFSNKISKNEAPFFYKIGIHPRTICEELKEKRTIPDQIKKALEVILKDDRCLGIGEIGLETFDDIEEEIFISQLRWCKNYLPDNKRIGIHTPRSNKYELTKKILDILKNFSSLHTKIVIDHVDINTMSLIKGLDVYIGMTLQYGKSTGEHINKVINENMFPMDKILLNSDGGKEISIPYIDFIDDNFFDNTTKDKLLKQNAVVFYNLIR